MAIWWTSDPHFKHKAVIRFCRRPFETTDEMDDALIANYNKYVNEYDTLIFVGDLSLDKKVNIRKILYKINCKNKILVQGNHDTKTALPRDCFSLIVQEMVVKINGVNVVVSHFPYRWPYWKHVRKKLQGHKPRYRSRRPVDNGLFLIHGHTHSSEKQNGRMIHVGVDAWDLKPVNNDKIAQLIAQQLHRETTTKPTHKMRKKYHVARKRVRYLIRKLFKRKSHD